MVGWRLVFPFLAAAMACASARAATLDQKAVHAVYEEGDFDKVTAKIAAFQKANPTYSRDDSVFIAKHLAVIYAANPETLEKGKYWMYQMLKIMPAADLVDMYVSEEIDRIFDRIRVEFVRRQAQFGVDTAKLALPSKQPSGASAARPHEAERPAPEGGKERPASTWKKTGLWVAGGLGLAAAGTAAYFLLSEQSGERRVEDIEIPKSGTTP
jgi:hypothetical protein